MTRLISVSRDDLEGDKALLFDARNLVEAIGLVIEDDDDLYFVIQSLARIAVEKIDAVAGGNVIDHLATDEERADLEELLGAEESARLRAAVDAAGKLRAEQEGPAR